MSSLDASRCFSAENPCNFHVQERAQIAHEEALAAEHFIARH